MEGKENQFRAWIATVGKDFQRRFDDDDFLHLVEFRFSENFVTAKFDGSTRKGQMLARIAWEYQLMLRDAGLGFDCWIDERRLGLMPLDYRSTTERLQDRLPPGFQVQEFEGINVKVIAPSLTDAYRFWFNIENIVNPHLIEYWAYLWIGYREYSIIRREPIVALLKRFNQI